MTLSKTAVRDVLARHPWFAGEAAPVLDALLVTGQTVTYARNAQIFAKAEPGDSLVMVLTGVVKIWSVSLDGRESVLSFLADGDLLGEIAALDGGPRTANATAMEPVEAFLWRRNAFLEVMQRYPAFALKVVTVLCARLRHTNVMIEAAVQLPMAARVARGLVSLLRRAGRETADGWRLDFRLTQRDLGAYVGLARENVNRQLKIWEAEGLIKLERGEVIVRDRDGLESLAELDEG